MRLSSRTTTSLSLSLAVLLGLSTTIRAMEDPSRWSLGVEAGRAFPLAPSDFSTNYNDTSHYGARLRQDLSEHWSMAATFSSQSYKQKTDSSQKIITQPLLL